MSAMRFSPLVLIGESFYAPDHLRVDRTRRGLPFYYPRLTPTPPLYIRRDVSVLFFARLTPLTQKDTSRLTCGPTWQHEPLDWVLPFLFRML